MSTGGLRNAIMASMEKSKPASAPIKQMRKNEIKAPESKETLLIVKKLDALFQCEKNPKEEVKFIQQMFTRGAGSEERVGLHASAIITSDNDFCYRQQVLSLLYRQNKDEQISPGLRRIFEQGNAIHEKWQRLFIRGGLGTAFDMDRTRLSDEYELTFTPDAIINMFNRKYVVEIKSMNTFAFQRATSHPSGRKQMQLYMHMLGIPQGFVLADDKNSQDFKVFHEYYNPFIVQPFISRLNEVQEMKRLYLEYKELPNRQCKNSACKRAKECNMVEACYNIGLGKRPICEVAQGNPMKPKKHVD